MRYPNYCATPEAIWFSSVPSTWRATKMREVFSERREKGSDKDYAPLSVGKMGVVPQLETAVKTDNGDNRKLIRKGDFAINSRSDRKGASGISEYDGSSSLIITVLKPHNELNGKFYHYLLRSHYFTEEFYRNGRGLVSDLWTTRWEEMKNIYIPIPPRDEQDHIVRFLDWKVSTVNKLINAKRQEIKSLVELKRSMVSSVVTRGLSQNVPMKNSGVKWLGDIPAHWEIVPLCAIAKEKSICDCVDLPLLSVYLDEGVILFSEKEEKRTNVTSKDLSKYQRVDPGDFVLNNQQAWRGSVGVSNHTGIVSPAYIVASLDDTLDRTYANYLLRSRKMVDQYLVISRGVGSIQRNIYWTSLKRVVVPVPPKEEQKMIVSNLEESDRKLSEAADRLKREIETLEEYKTKLIADVVTGKIDVRGIEIPEYEFVEEVGIDETDEDSDNTDDEES